MPPQPDAGAVVAAVHLVPVGELREQQQAPAAGRVWLLAEDPADRELVFDFGFDEELNAAVKRLPRRWFDWRRKHWRVPADPRSSMNAGAATSWDRAALTNAAVVGDPFPFGIEPNRKALEAITQFAFDQRMVPRKLSVEELFA